MVNEAADYTFDALSSCLFSVEFYDWFQQQRKKKFIEKFQCIGIFHPLEWKIGHLFNWMHEMCDGPIRWFTWFFHSSSLKIPFYYCSRTKWLKKLMEQNENEEIRNSISWLAKSLFNITANHLQWRNHITYTGIFEASESVVVVAVFFLLLGVRQFVQWKSW